jgi:hypothetical protein
MRKTARFVPRFLGRRLILIKALSLGVNLAVPILWLKLNDRGERHVE